MNPFTSFENTHFLVGCAVSTQTTGCIGAVFSDRVWCLKMPGGEGSGQGQHVEKQVDDAVPGSRASGGGSLRSGKIMGFCI